MDHVETELLQIIDTLPLKPEGMHAIVQFDARDPQPYVLYKNTTYTLLLRPHSMFDPTVYDLFEVIMLQNEAIVYKEDVFMEAAHKASIRDAIRAYNDSNMQLV